MQIIENPTAVIELINSIKMPIKHPNATMRMTIENVSKECMEKVFNHYRPDDDFERKVNEPTDAFPYFWCTVKTDLLQIELDAPHLEKIVTFK